MVKVLVVVVVVTVVVVVVVQTSPGYLGAFRMKSPPPGPSVPHLPQHEPPFSGKVGAAVAGVPNPLNKAMIPAMISIYEF